MSGMTTGNTGDLKRKEVMAKKPKAQPVKGTKKQKKISKVMREFKAGTLHSGKNPKGPKKAKVVKNPKQAIAIALSEARKVK
jgi:hypothetical protein